MAYARDEKELAELLKKRSRRFAIDTVRLCRHFPRTIAGYVVGRQLIKAATATAANYRAACRSRSPADFISRISVVSEEADESQFWLDIAVEVELTSGSEARRLLAEAASSARYSPNPEQRASRTKPKAA